MNADNIIGLICGILFSTIIFSLVSLHYKNKRDAEKLKETNLILEEAENILQSLNNTRVLNVPSDKVFELLESYDRLIGSNSSKTANYMFWKEVASIFPEVAKGNWTIEFPNVWSIQIVEKRPYGQ